MKNFYLSITVRTLWVLIVFSLTGTISFINIPTQFGSDVQWGSLTAAENMGRKTIQLINQYKHNPDSYCQGLEYAFDRKENREILYESVGRYGSSKLLKTDLKTGQILQEHVLADKFFAEGLAVIDDQIYQLTWREGICFVYDKETFSLKSDYRFRTEGWGLTYNGKHLIVSDGSNNIYYWDPKTLHEKKKISVWYRDRSGKKRPLAKINELEYIDGEIWANIYQTSFLVRINPKSGEALQFFNCSSLVPKDLANSDDLVMNGIAFDKENNRLFITGKCWPVLYEMKIEKEDKQGDK